MTDGVEREECRVCQSDDPNTVDGRFVIGLCKPCSRLVERRSLSVGESIDEAVRHFRPDDDGLRADGSGERADGIKQALADAYPGCSDAVRGWDWPEYREALVVVAESDVPVIARASDALEVSGLRDTEDTEVERPAEVSDGAQ